jgi:L-lactate dehydrogenase complex protein LldE
MLNTKRQVSLFIPCLVDQVYPEIGLSMVKILRHFGYPVVYDQRQTCCGQPAFNAGHWGEARTVAENFIEVFSSAEVIVAPSGSCTAMVRNYYPVLFKRCEQEAAATALGAKVFEFSQFLNKEKLIEKINGSYRGKVGFHNSCHSYRELHIDQEPFAILKQIQGINLLQPPGEPICCGFGGLFSFKYEQIASTMAKSRLQQFIDLGVETLITNDPGCMMHLCQEAKYLQIQMKIIHLATFLENALSIKD